MNLFLAPLQSMTTAFYRNAFARIFGGIDAYYSPFIATQDVKKINDILLKDILPEQNDPGIKVIPQLLSNDGNDFRRFSSAIVSLGYNEINWNIGCPYPMVTNKKKGSGILPYPDMIEKFLDIACADSSYSISVKMRLGLYDTVEGIRIINVLNQFPLKGVIIHPRTGKQMYTGSVDLDSFEALLSACRHEVTYNGDICTYEHFMNISSRFPTVNNFMLGRGALQDPFLPCTIKGRNITYASKISMIRQFHDEIYNYYKNRVSGDKHLLDRMKEFWVYMSVHLDREGKLLKKIKKCHTAAAYLETVNPILNSSDIWSDLPLS